MLLVRELAELARKMDPVAFATQMGPFALMQRPASEARAEKSRAAGPKRTMALPTLAQLEARPPPPVDFADLYVATLPPPAPDGTLELIIGRSPDSDLVVEDPAVSSRHASIRWDGRDGVIVELGSVNGTFINGQKLMNETQVKLKTGDQLGFGQSYFIYLLAAELHTRLSRVF